MTSADRNEALRTYIGDFKEIIEYVDHEVFGVAELPLARVVVNAERIEGLLECAHIGRYSSVLFRVPDEWCGSAVPLRREIDTYVIWADHFTRMVNRLVRVNITSISDVEMKKVWFLSAVALVRVRVLHHPKWFPQAKRRNIRSMTKYHDIVGPEIFCLKKDFEASQRALINLDIYLTQSLIAAAIEKEMSLPEVLQYIALD